MKKCFIALFLGMLASIASAQTIVNQEGIRYHIEDGKAIIGRQNKELAGNVIIPSYITYEGQDYPVTGFTAPTNITAWSNNTVTTEGGAFQDCQIESIELPSTITIIEAGAFAGCTKLEYVVLPENLLQIGAASFAGCSSLMKLDVPESVTSFASNSRYGAISYTFGGCSGLKEINIPSKITSLEDGCFKNAGIEEIEIPEGMLRLGDDCLALPSLKKLKMGVRNLAKLNYSKTCLGDVSNAELLVPAGTIAVYQEYEPWSNFGAMYEFGDNNGEEFKPSQINIVYGGIKYIIKDGTAIIGRQSKETSDEIVIPEYVEYQDEKYNVTGMVDPTDLTSYSGGSISCVGGAFQGSNITSIVLPQHVKIISAGAFQNCRSLTSVTLPSELKQISAAAFAGCNKLESINIPEGVTDLGSNTAYGYRSYVFGGCTSLKEITIPEGVRRLASGCFMGSGIENLTVPSSCKTFDQYCLNTSSLKVLKICVKDMYSMTYSDLSFGDVSKVNLIVPLGSKQVYEEYYPWRSFLSIEEFDDGSDPYTPSKITTTIDGVRYILDNGIATIGRQNKELSGDIVIPEYVEYNEVSFKVTGIVEPTNLISWSSNTVTTENGAFQSCPITSIELPVSITKISAGAFNGCAQLKYVKLPENVTQLGAASFANCTSLEELYLPETVTNLASDTRYGMQSYTFGGCKNLKKINLPKGITRLYDGCFKGSGITTFLIPNTLQNLAEDCFSVGTFKAIKICHKDFRSFKYTESSFANVSNITLYVPEGSKSLYEEFYPWKNFKEIKEYEEQYDEIMYNAYSITYRTNSGNDYSNGRRKANSNGEDVYAKNYVASGVEISDVPNPIREGYIFKGWTSLPNVMPATDVVVDAIWAIQGDVDSNNSLSINDVSELTNIILEKGQSNADIEAADMDSNNSITVSDCVKLIEKILDNK